VSGRLRRSLSSRQRLVLWETFPTYLSVSSYGLCYKTGTCDPIPRTLSWLQAAECVVGHTLWHENVRLLFWASKNIVHKKTVVCISSWNLPLNIDPFFGAAMFILLIKPFFESCNFLAFATHSCVVSNKVCRLIKQLHNQVFRKNSFCLWNRICNWF